MVQTSEAVLPLSSGEFQKPRWTRPSTSRTSQVPLYKHDAWIFNLSRPTLTFYESSHVLQQGWVTSFSPSSYYTGCLQMSVAVSKVNKKFISHLTRAQRTPSAAATVQVSHALPAVRFSCLQRGRGASFQDGVAAGKGFLCAPFWGVQICDYSAVQCTV